MGSSISWLDSLPSPLCWLNVFTLCDIGKKNCNYRVVEAKFFFIRLKGATIMNAFDSIGWGTFATFCTRTYCISCSGKYSTSVCSIQLPWFCSDRSIIQEIVWKYSNSMKCWIKQYNAISFFFLCTSSYSVGWKFSSTVRFYSMCYRISMFQNNTFFVILLLILFSVGILSHVNLFIPMFTFLTNL